MTLKGTKNHYNVKFLKGYGHLISVKDSKVIAVFSAPLIMYNGKMHALTDVISDQD